MQIYGNTVHKWRILIQNHRNIPGKILVVSFGEAVDGWKTPFVHTSSQQKSRSRNNYSIAGLSKTKSHPIVSNSVFYICLYYSWYHGRNIMDNSPTVCSISYHVSGVKQRAGLRVCPERNEWCLKEAHFTAQAQCFMTLVHLWVPCSTSNFWKNLSEKWTLCGLHACRPFPVFHFFWRVRNMVNCSMGPKILQLV